VLLSWPFARLVNHWRLRSLRRKALDARVVLGQRLHEQKAGDAKLRGEIDVLNERILGQETTLGLTKPLKAERRGLLMRLAAPVLALETAPAGVEAEHRKARASQTALLTYQERRVTQAARQPPPRVRWRRLGIGYGVLGVVAAVIFLLLWLEPWEDEADGPARQYADAGSLAARKTGRTAKKQAGADGGRKKSSPRKRTRSGKGAEPAEDGKAVRKEGRPAPKPQREEEPDDPEEKKPKKDRRADDEKGKPARDKAKPRPAEKPLRGPFAKAMRSVALVRGWKMSASGFLARPGVLVTSWNVVLTTPLDRLTVTFPSADDEEAKPVKASLLYFDAARNLAILAVETKLPPLRLALPHRFIPNRVVHILSRSATARNGAGQNRVAQGVMIRPTEVRNGLDTVAVNEVQTVPRPDKYGAPVLDELGEVIGVISFVKRPTSRDRKPPQVVYCTRLLDLHTMLSYVEKQGEEATARVASAHRQQVVFWRLAGAGNRLAGMLKACEKAMMQATRARQDPVAALAAWKKANASRLEQFDEDLEDETVPLLESLDLDRSVSRRTLQAMRELLGLCNQMRKHLDNLPRKPFGDVEIYRRKSQDLLRQLDLRLASLNQDLRREVPFR
jgi:hypothetical protein